MASTLGAFVTLTAVGAFMAFTDSSGRVESETDQAAELRFISGLLSTDLANLYRDRSYDRMKLVGGMDPSGGQGQCYLTFYTVSRARVRPGQPEGDVQEVEYYIVPKEESSLFMRRVWPNPHKEAQPGGLLTVLSEEVQSFQVRFYDGQQWLEQWDETQRTLPSLLEITIVGNQEEHREPPVERVFINFPRCAPNRDADTESTEETPGPDTGAGSETPRVQGEGTMPRE